MKNKKTLMFITIIMVLIFSNFKINAIYTHKMMTEITSLDDILPVVSGDIDHVSLLIYLHEDSPNSHKMEPIIVEYTE